MDFLKLTDKAVLTNLAANISWIPFLYTQTPTLLTIRCKTVTLNALHDRAFELGLFTIRPEDYVIEVAPAVRHPKRPDADAVGALLGRFHGQGLRLPARRRFLPDPALLAWHRAKWRG